MKTSVYNQTLLEQYLDKSVAEQCIELYVAGVFRSQAHALLAMFQKAQVLCDGFIPTSTLRKYFSQYNARILELRRGVIDNIPYCIVAERFDGVYGFRYRGIRLSRACKRSDL